MISVQIESLQEKQTSKTILIMEEASSINNDDLSQGKVEIIFEEGIVPFSYMSEESYYSDSTTRTPPITLKRCCTSYYWMFLLCMFAMERECAQTRNLFSPILL